MSAPADPKSALRREVIARRDALPAGSRAAKSAAIGEAVAALPEFRRAEVVLLFAPFGSEVDTVPLMRQALDAGQRLLLPRVVREEHRLALHEVREPAEDLRPGVWNIPEPDPTRCPERPLAAVGFVLAPGVAFDEQGGRLGYGGGYYDRLLGALAPGVGVVAVCFECQIVPEVPRHAHDLLVPAIVTEARIRRRPE